MINKNLSHVADYWKFLKELRSQINLVKVLEREFFELEDLCDWSVKNDVTVMDEKTGKRVAFVEDRLGKQQRDVYESLRVEVGNLYDILSTGKSCFEADK